VAGAVTPDPVRIELPGGDRVLVRPVRASDKDAIADGFNRMGERSRVSTLHDHPGRALDP
jgi:hypothetical protein